MEYLKEHPPPPPEPLAPEPDAVLTEPELALEPEPDDALKACTGLNVDHEPEPEPQPEPEPEPRESRRPFLPSQSKRFLPPRPGQRVRPPSRPSAGNAHEGQHCDGSLSDESYASLSDVIGSRSGSGSGSSSGSDSDSGVEYSGDMGVASDEPGAMQTTTPMTTRHSNVDMQLAAPNDHGPQINIPAPTPEAPPAPLQSPDPTEAPTELAAEVALSDEVAAREAKKAKMRALMFS